MQLFLTVLLRGRERERARARAREREREREGEGGRERAREKMMKILLMKLCIRFCKVFFCSQTLNLDFCLS
jgi:hypothetical protein